MRRIVLLIAVFAIGAITLLRLTPDPRPQTADPDTTRTERTIPEDLQPEHSGSITPIQANASSGGPAEATPDKVRLLELHGKVTDSHGEPIEGALITEQRYFFSVTSDAAGDYRIVLDLPPQRLPQVRVYRAGYGVATIPVSRAERLRSDSLHRDVVLNGDATTLRLPGRVVDESGVGLEGVRIEISSKPHDDEKNYYLTVFSDAEGDFMLEGLPGDRYYRLWASLLPEYPIYREPDFYVGNTPGRLDIRIEPMRFVTLSGMMLNRDREPIGDFEMFINNPAAGRRKQRIVSDSSGYFTLDNFPLGEVMLTTHGAESHKIIGLLLDETNYAGIELIIDRGDRLLEGWVRDENGTAVSRAMVTLDAELKYGKVESTSYRSQTTDDYGQFSFGDIARGQHRLRVYAEGYVPLRASVDLQQTSEQIWLQLQSQR